MAKAVTSFYLSTSAALMIPGLAIGAAVSVWLGKRMFRERQNAAARAPAQAMFGVVTLGWALISGSLITAGLHGGWALEWQALLGLGTLLSAVWGIGQIGAAGIGLLSASLGASGGAHGDEDPYWLVWLGPTTLAFVVLTATVYLERRLPTTAPRAALLAVGGLLLAAAVVWPRWFAQHYLVDELLHRVPSGVRRAVLGAAGLLAIVLGA